jgi:hypothetical protein
VETANTNSQLSMSPLELGVGFGHWQHFHIGTFLFIAGGVAMM